MHDAWSLWEKVFVLCGKLFSSQALMEALADPSFLVAAFIVVTLVIFVETGLLVGFCLPGDSLLVTTGLVFYQLIHVHGVPGWTFPLLLGLVSAAALPLSLPRAQANRPGEMDSSTTMTITFST